MIDRNPGPPPLKLRPAAATPEARPCVTVRQMLNGSLSAEGLKSLHDAFAKGVPIRLVNEEELFRAPDKPPSRERLEALRAALESYKGDMPR